MPIQMKNLIPRQPLDNDPMSAFFTCPRGHKLPHRVKGKGRCAPFDCCVAADGAHGVVRKHEKQNLAEGLAYAEQQQQLAEMRDQMRAWNELHELPEVPPPPKTKSIAEYMKKRLEQIAPLALERRIRVAIHDPGHQGEVAARELLNRSGYTERPEFHQTFTGPVFIVGDAKQVAASSPYAAQGKLQDNNHAGVIDGQWHVEGAGGREGRRARDAAGHVASGEGDLDGGPGLPEEGSTETP